VGAMAANRGRLLGLLQDHRKGLLVWIVYS
jgi:hypothetical protein